MTFMVSTALYSSLIFQGSGVQRSGNANALSGLNTER